MSYESESKSISFLLPLHVLKLKIYFTELSFTLSYNDMHQTWNYYSLNNGQLYMSKVTRCRVQSDCAYKYCMNFSVYFISFAKVDMIFFK